MDAFDQDVLLWPEWSIPVDALCTDFDLHAMHVWCVPMLDATQIDWACALLRPDERTTYLAMQHPKAQQQFLSGRVALRCLLGKHLQQTPQSVPLTVGKRGKPCLTPSHGPLYFNVSHGGGRILIACASVGEVGVDIESSQRALSVMAIAKRYFHPKEALALSKLAPKAQHAAFVRMWVIKEAMLKAVGQGVGNGLNRLELSAHWPHDVRAVHAAPDASWGAWQVRVFGVSPDGVAAVATHAWPMLNEDVVGAPKMAHWRWSWRMAQSWSDWG